ncbi:MAG: GNAT family N-acetyltransferase [Bacteroidota bacterium]
MPQISDHTFKREIINILSRAFDDNLSVNYVIKQGAGRKRRIKELIEYSYQICKKYGVVYINGNTTAVALILRSDRKRFTPFLDLRLAISSITFPRLLKIFDRETKLKKRRVKEPHLYLWFIGVDPIYQNTGLGSELLTEVLKYADDQGLPICLETSKLSNVPWYKRNEFEVYDSIDDFGFDVVMMRRTKSKKL